jgi:CheY-like chemotaxis protein
MGDLQHISKETARSRVLIVHGESAERARLRSLLRAEFKCVADEAASVTEAVTCLGRTRYDLVLCDHHVAGESGLDVFRFLKKVAPRGTFFLLFTGPQETRAIPETSQIVTVEAPSSEELVDAIRFLGVPVR